MSGTTGTPRTRAWLGAALALLLGGLIGAIAASVLGRADADPAPALGPVWVAVFLIGVVAAMLLVLAIHEAGHLLAGRLVGFRFFLLIVGPIRIGREGEAIRVGWNRSLALAGGLAGTAPARDDDLNDLPRRTAWMVAGGPLTSLLVGLGLVAASLATGLHDVPEGSGPGWTVGGRLLQVAAFASLGIGLITLVPARTSGFLTDGGRLLQILRGGAAAQADTALTVIVAWSMAGLRPREWDSEVVQRALSAPPGPFRAVARHSAWRHAADRGREEEAAEYRTALLEALDEAPSAVRAAIALDVAVERAMAGDVEAARRRIEEAGPPGPLTDPHLLPLARAAVAAAEGRWDAFRGAADEARDLLHRAMDPSARVVDEERLAELRTRAPPRPDSPGA